MNPRTSTVPNRVSDIMTRDPISVPPSTTARELARILLDNEISGVPVVDEQDRVIGVVSRTDLLLRFVEGPEGSVRSTFIETLAEGMAFDAELDPEQLGFVEDIMTPEPVAVSPEDTVAKVAHLMADEHVHRAIVVDDRERLVGIVTSLDILRVFPR